MEVQRYLTKPWNNAELIDFIRTSLLRGKQLRQERKLAEEARDQQHLVSSEDRERQLLEAEEPGITKVRWGEDGAVILHEEE